MTMMELMDMRLHAALFFQYEQTIPNLAWSLISRGIRSNSL